MKFLPKRSSRTTNVATVYSNGISFPTSDNPMIPEQNDQVRSPLGEFKSGYDGDGEDATSISDLFASTCIEKKTLNQKRKVKISVSRIFFPNANPCAHQKRKLIN